MREVSIDRAGPVRKGEELDLDRLGAYLRDNLPLEGGASHGSLVVEQFPSGFSNLTYLVRLGDVELVLRRPPFGNRVKSAHDMGREYRVLSKLCAVYPPAPRPLLFCDDPEVIGDTFYVMERRRGVVLRRGAAPRPLRGDPTLVRGLCESFIDNLAALHTLDYFSAGLGDLGRPEGYVERQVSGWIRRYENARTSEVEPIERLGEWLAANRPAESRAALIHNDYKYDNLILDPADLTHIVAVLDWEMATIGDPLLDLGATLAYWVEPGDPESRHADAFGPTMLPGSMTRRELLERYRERTGIEISDPLFYYCFGLYKLAVIVQQIYARWHRGHTRDERFATLDRMVESLGREGDRAVGRGSV